MRRPIAARCIGAGLLAVCGVIAWHVFGGGPVPAGGEPPGNDPPAAPHISLTAAQACRREPSSPQRPIADADVAPPSARVEVTVDLVLVDDGTGEPLPGGTVALDGPGQAEGEAGEFRAGANGEVRCGVAWQPPVARGDRLWLRLTCRAPAYLERTLTVSAATAGPIALGTIALAREYVLTGSLTYVDGGPAALVPVHVVAVDRLPASLGDVLKHYALADCGSLRTTSDVAGCFRIAGLPWGAVDVWASVAEGMNENAARAVVLDRNRATHIVGRLQRRDAAECLTGMVVQDGTPVAGARVEVLRSRDGDRSKGRSTITSADGRFSLLVEAVGPWDIRATAVERQARSEWLCGAVAGAADITLDLRRAPMLSLGVFGADGQRWPSDCTLYLIPAGNFVSGADRPPLVPRLQSVVVPERAGDIAVLEPDVPYGVRALASGRSGWIGPVVADGNDRALRIDLGAPLTCIRGRVTAAGRGVAGARVWQHIVSDFAGAAENGFSWRALAAHGCVVTDAQGAFELPGVVLGSSLLCVRDPELGGAEIEVPALAPGEVIDVEVALRIGGTIEGRVDDPAGSAGAGAVVGVTTGDGSLAITRTAADGTFRFAALPPGTWQCAVLDGEVTADHARNARPIGPVHRVTLAGGATHWLDLEGPPPASVPMAVRVIRR